MLTILVNTGKFEDSFVCHGKFTKWTRTRLCLRTFVWSKGQKVNVKWFQSQLFVDVTNCLHSLKVCFTLELCPCKSILSFLITKCSERQDGVDKVNLPQITVMGMSEVKTPILCMNNQQSINQTGHFHFYISNSQQFSLRRIFDYIHVQNERTPFCYLVQLNVCYFTAASIRTVVTTSAGDNRPWKHIPRGSTYQLNGQETHLTAPGRGSQLLISLANLLKTRWKNDQSRKTWNLTCRLSTKFRQPLKRSCILPMYCSKLVTKETNVLLVINITMIKKYH